MNGKNDAVKSIDLIQYFPVKCEWSTLDTNGKESP